MFGKPAFGSPAPSTSFGSTGLFGQPAATGGGLFNSTSTFGQQNKPTGFGFGTPQQNNTFLGAQQPQTTSIFNPSGSTGLFGGSTAFGSQPTGTVIKFNPVTGTDTMMKNGTAQSISTKHHSITCMKEYENKSFEELRFEDYQANRKGQQGTTGFGAPVFGAATSATPSLFGQADANKSAFGQAGAFGQTSTFGQNTTGQQGTTGFGAPVFGAATSATPSLFGQADANKSAFGQAGAFGQTSTFGQNTTGGFGLGAQQNTTGSPFGKPTAFGAPTSSTGFGFGTNTAQNVNPFGGATANKPFGTTTAAQPLGFGTNTSQPNTGFGTGLFSNTQNTGTGLFNKPAQPTGGFGTAGQTPGFSFNTPASTQSSLFTNTSKSLFGGNTTSTAPAFGTTNTFGATNTGFGSTFGKPNTAPFGQTSGIGSFSSGFGSTGFGASNTSFGNTFGKPTAPVFGQSQAPGLGTFNSGGLGTTTSTGLFGNQNQAKPGGLFGNSNSLFNNNSAMTFQQNSFGVGPLNQQQMSLLAQPEQNTNNLALLTTDPFGDAPHLAGLEPKLRSNSDAVSATDPKELKSLLDASKKVDMSHNSKLKVTPLKNARDSLFDSIPKPSDNIKSPLANYQKTSVRRLVLKQRPSGENTPGLNSTNILDVLTSEDKENRNLDSSGGGGGGGGIGKANPLKLTFDVTANNDSFVNNSVETQTFNIVNSTSKDQLPDHSLRESPPPPSDDDDLGDNKGAGDTIKRHPANIVCTRPEYYTLPSLDDLIPDENGACIVKGFTVGRKGYGNVYFPDEMDVAGLNLDELVHFRYREINVYPDDAKKPPVGQGLNRKAQVTLDNVYPRRTGSNALIKDVGELIQMNFAEKLRKVTEKKNARFVDYRPETGSWVFKVDHFSKYGFNDSDEENDQNGAGATKKAVKQGELQKTSKPLELSAKECLEDKAKDQEIISRETSEGSQEPSSGAFRLDKDILIDDDEHEENDLLHHSMMVDEGSEDDYHHHLHTEMSMDYGSYTRNQRAKNIQLMKSTLFADDDRSSEDARSHISIMKQYLDLPEIDEISRLPTLPEEVPARKRAILRPKVWKSYLLANATPVLPSRCCVDMGMFKGKSFRAGWSKGFNFYALGNGDKESSTELVLKAIDASSAFDPLKDILSNSLKIVLEESTHHLSASKVPTFKILKSDSYLKKQSAVFEKLASQYNSSQANYLYSIWTLCSALWGPGENTIANRRYLLSEWLKSTCNNDELTLKSGPFKSVGEASESVFSHLSVFKVFDAAAIAMNTKLPNLSLLVAQLSMSNAAKGFVQEQIDIWYRSLASNQISRELKRLYLLLSGIPTKDDVNIFENIDWKRAFGMHLWYICPNGAPIETAIDLYKKAFEEYAYAERPNPPYVKNYSDEGPFDMMYHILLLYKSGIHRLSSVLNPATHTDDPLDYRLSWLLLQLFLSLDVGLIESSEINKLCTSFSTQLEHLGHWEWAIFVLLHMEDNSVKTNIIMSILDRNLNADFDEDTQETVDLLVNEMKIPPEWLHTVKGNKSLAMEKYFEAFNHFSLAEDYIKANNIFVDKLLPNLFISEQFDVIRSLSEKLKPASKDIQHWQNEAGLVLDYLDLLEQSITSENIVRLQMKLCSLSDRIVSFPTTTDPQKLCVAELSKRCASLYKDLCYKSNSNLLENSYIQFVETLIMPPDFKKNEGLYLIHDFYNFRINNRV